MSREIVSVLVVPADGDPGGLLAKGLGGSRPPVAVHRMAHQVSVWQIGEGAGAFVRALPLWWDGELVPEGWDRARRLFEGSAFARKIRVAAGRDYTHLPADPSVGQVLELADSLLVCGASRVVRLARVDGLLVEVTGG